MLRDEIIQKLNSRKSELKELKVKSLSLFGSVARGEETPSSDVDILVEFDSCVGLFQFSRVRFFLSDLLGKPVDLTTIEALRPRIREQILRERIHAA